MNIRILVVDDERAGRDVIRSHLAKFGGDFEIQEAANGLEALSLIRSWRPHVVFLDIDMPKLNGFDVLREVENRDFQVIFQTAYDEFALEAFEVSACDYLLKPFTEIRFRKAMERASSAAAKPAAQPEPVLERYLAAQGRPMERLVIPVGDRSKVIPASEVVCFTSDDHETRIFLESGDYWYDHSLKYLEENLSPDDFFRAHRNAMINVRHIKGVSWGKPIRILLTNGREIVVAKERAAVFRKKFRKGAE